MGKRTRLAKRAYHAFKVINNNELNKRRVALQSIEDYSFSLLLVWIEIETLLKLLRYYKKMSDGFPEILNFINKNWSILNNIYCADSKKYDLVLEKKADTLRNIRNDIVHNGIIISSSEHKKYYEPAIWIKNMLNEQLQPQEVFLSRRRRLKI